MDHNILINILRNGYSYEVNEEELEPYQVSYPPTRYTMEAARLLQKVLPQLDMCVQRINQLQTELADQVAESVRLRQLLNTPTPNLDEKEFKDA
jgi:hypothetical protein